MHSEKGLSVYIFSKILIALIIFIHPFLALSQNDTLKTIDLQEIGIRGFKELSPVTSLQERTFLIPIGGRKTEVIRISDLPANIAEKTGRQIFAQIPGAFVYDMDGPGNQVNLSVRGLDPHRSWEFNVRQNNIIINTDIYGYPASHYSMPMEAVERIELVRGTGALQYGQQFGGMLNYVLKSPDTTRNFGFENMTTFGSFGLFSSFNAIGGRVGKWTYYGYYQNRTSNGYRDHARSDSDAQHFSLTFAANEDLSIKAEISRSTYLYQSPGPLSDQMFRENPRQASRFRNFYSPEIWVPALTLDYRVGPNTHIQWISSIIYGKRGDIAFPGNALAIDNIRPETNSFAPRNVAIHYYNSRTSELRMLHEYKLGKIKNDLSISSRYFNNINDRNQRGRGSSNTFFDLSVDGNFENELTLHSRSLAFAIENQIYIKDNFTVSPGLRYENGRSDLTGSIAYLEERQVPQEILYDFLTLGVHGQWFNDKGVRIFGGISQANRPVLFQDLVPGDPFARIAEGLQHSLGYNTEVGIENRKHKYLQYNLTFFRTFIGNRIGNLIDVEAGQTFVTKSNIGDSQTDGIELWLNGVLYNDSKAKISIFNASSYMDGRYVAGTLRSGSENVSIVGNRIESVPEWIIRTGLTIELGRFKSLLQHQYVSETFADPLNTIIPSPDGAVGSVPEYHIFDWNSSFSLSEKYVLRFGVNNLLNRQYFIKRPTMYPGAGIWPSDGRSVVVSVNVKI
ncbi:Fe(3+) dicitrate transport protein [Cecembia calidifontis]|uniref:Fe(3+) dicitrate transport protein n=1 Tax=Cecembia calidifontis TaxID=1187080 RepID=A0A4Q7P898_9BACT|nr:Fe(3+) dicitrate transport protein [Cecembia calidifontis]